MSSERLPIETFDIPVQKIRRGYYSAVYFWREKQILERLGYDTNVLMQVFQKNDAILCGTDEAIAVLKTCSGYYKDLQKACSLFDRLLKVEKFKRRVYAHGKYKAWKLVMEDLVDIETELDGLWQNTFDDLDVNALYDGDKVVPWETVMTIGGLPQHFAHLESVYLGIMARRTLVATNVYKVVQAAQDKPILFFADRFDHYSNQTGDGYAAMKAGAFGVASDTMGEWWGSQGTGTTPHALIACFYGDTVEATLAFAREYPDVPCISLVDFHNDCIKTSLEVAGRFRAEGLTLWGVRLDTSERMVDASILRNGKMGRDNPTGVTADLVCNERKALDKEGHHDVKIVVSGGFTEEKINRFEREGVPTDAYGCGSSLIKGSNDFTADIVQVGGKHCAKVGRQLCHNPRVDKVL